MKMIKRKEKNLVWREVLTWFYSNAFVERTLLFLTVLVAFYYSESIFNNIIPKVQKKYQPVSTFYG